MRIQQESLIRLRDILNEESTYRTGPVLVKFFNQFGFNDSYGQGFPSRKNYTDDRLNILNEKGHIEKVIKSIFAPVAFIGNLDHLKALINNFNEFLLFDDVKLVLEGKTVNLIKGNIDMPHQDSNSETEFINKEFKEVNLEKLSIDPMLVDISNQRLQEIKNCLHSKAPLAAIFLCGSTLEGLLLGVAYKHIKSFNQSISAPKDKSGKVKIMQERTLSNLIDVACALNYLGEDVKKFSHALRDFRNYIHPYQQMSSNFRPNDHTAKICWQVLQAAIDQLSRSI